MRIKAAAIVLVMVFMTATAAMAANLAVTSATGAPGDQVDVNVNVDAAGVAGAAFTITYNPAVLTLNGVQSTFFDTFANQLLTPTSVEVDGTTYTQPLVSNQVANGAMVAAARVQAGPAGTLFTLSFSIAQGAAPGNYQVNLVPSVINNVDAGYPAEGAPVPMLNGALADNDPNFGNLSLAFPEIPVQNVAAGQITVADGATLNDVAIDFAGAGLWVYKTDTQSWTQISTADAGKMIYFGGKVIAVFPGAGLWQYDGANWIQISTATPDDLVSIGNALFVDFGVYGLWKLESGNWTWISTANPAMLEEYNGQLAVAFTGFGVWLHDVNANTWSQISTADPEDLASVGTALYVDFGAAGLYRFNGTFFEQLSTANPFLMEGYAGNKLAVVFTGFGLWLFDGGANTWDQISTADPENIITKDADLFIDFGAAGIWLFNGTNWTQISTSNPALLTIVGNKLAVSFTGYGVYLYDLVSSTWEHISNGEPQNMVPVDF